MILEKSTKIIDNFEYEYAPYLDEVLDFYIQDNEDGTNTIIVHIKDKNFEFPINIDTDVDEMSNFMYSTLSDVSYDESFDDVLEIDEDAMSDLADDLEDISNIKDDLIHLIDEAIKSEEEAVEIYSNAMSRTNSLDRTDSYDSLVKLFEVILEDEKEHITLLNSYKELKM